MGSLAERILRRDRRVCAKRFLHHHHYHLLHPSPIKTLYWCREAILYLKPFISATHCLLTPVNLYLTSMGTANIGLTFTLLPLALTSLTGSDSLYHLPHYSFLKPLPDVQGHEYST